MNGYLAFYRGKQLEVYADSSHDAQIRASVEFKAKKRYEVSVILCEKDGKPVTYTPS